MNPIIYFFLFAPIVFSLNSNAAETPHETANVVEAGMSQDKLTNGYANWNSRYLDGHHSYGDRHAVYGELRQTSRFNLVDHEISGGYYHPLNATWTGVIGGNISPEHNVLAKESEFGQLQKAFDGGWGIQAGLRHSQYATAATDLLTMTAEKYWGNYRFGYSFFLGKPQGIGAAPSNMIQLSDYYGDHNYITVGVAQGIQVESLGAELGVLTTKVLSSSISGHHWFNSTWGLGYEAVVEHQGNLYLRESIRVGLLYAF
jgi:YaiO family outer membrane protein